MRWPTGTCEASGVAIHYERTGGSGPPVILLHGLSGNGACWRPVARAIEDEFDLLMPDARGHGASGTPTSGYSYEEHAADVVGLIQQLRLATPVILGHSMGGLTATLVASRLGGPIRALILADPTFLSPQQQRNVHASDVMRRPGSCKFSTRAFGSSWLQAPAMDFPTTNRSALLRWSAPSCIHSRCERLGRQPRAAWCNRSEARPGRSRLASERSRCDASRSSGGCGSARPGRAAACARTHSASWPLRARTRRSPPSTFRA